MPSESDTLGAQNVWNSNYKAVYHMDDDPASGGTIYDSTGNSHNGTSQGSMTSGDLVNGKFGKAINFDGDDDYISIPDSADFQLSTFTMQIWGEYEDTNDDSSYKLFSSYNSANILGAWTQIDNRSGQDEKFSQVVATAGTTVTSDPVSTILSQDTWYYMVGSHEAGGNLCSRVNTTKTCKATNGVSYDSTNYVRIGHQEGTSHYHYGAIEEVRYYAGVLSDNWISTEYNNQSSPSTFWTTGTWNTVAAAEPETLKRPIIKWFY